MKKKIISVLSLLVLAGTTQLFAWGIGIQGGANIGGAGGAAVTFKLDNTPLVFAADAGFASGYTSLGLTADYWIQNPEIMGDSWGHWNWFYGLGAAAGVGIGEDYVNFNVAPRALIGTNVTILDNFLEFYVQGAWQPTLYIGSNSGFALVYFPISGGVRFWF